VIDLRSGRAVHGRAGERRTYRPVVSRLGGGEPADLSDPRALLLAWVRHLRAGLVYVADLDRIAGRADNDETLRRMLEATPQVSFLWDGGLSGAAALGSVPRNGRIVPVIGTETLTDLEELTGQRRPATGRRPVLSLDLSDGGVVARAPAVARLGEEDLLRQAARRGVRAAILLLLRGVGTATGLPRARLLRLRNAAPRLELYAGGGIAGLDDLTFLREAGFSGALLATALHEGRIRPDELAAEGYLD
jgi:phosphoribosylformimino-5-aminoimidazole carboxamide ribotide isomerase